MYIEITAARCQRLRRALQIEIAPRESRSNAPDLVVLDKMKPPLSLRKRYALQQCGHFGKAKIPDFHVCAGKASILDDGYVLRASGEAHILTYLL